MEHGGHTFRIGQGNNVFIFPGLGLGALLSNSTVVTDDMVTAASHAVADAVADEELAAGMLYPDISRLRLVTRSVAQAVANKAIERGYANANAQDIEARLRDDLWQPDYPEIAAE